jgi:hypothetical protein
VALSGSILTVGMHTVSAPPRSLPGAQLTAAARVLHYVAAVEGVTPQVMSQDLQQGMTLLRIANGKYADVSCFSPLSSLFARRRRSLSR